MTDNVPPWQEFEALQQGFIMRLPERLGRIKSLFQDWQDQGNREALELLHRETHNLTGAAGSYQLATLSQTARQLEQTLRAACAHTVASPAVFQQQIQGIADEIARLHVKACS